ESLAHWFYHIDRPQERGFIRRSLRLEGEPLATVSVLGRSPPKSARADFHPASATFTLSRFAYLRRVERDWVLESPLSQVRITLHDFRAAAVVSALGAPATLEEIHRRASPLPAGAVRALMRMFFEAGMLAAVDDEERMVEREDDALRAWEFHDLLFH